MTGYTNFTKLHADTLVTESVTTDTLALSTKVAAIADLPATTATATETATAVNAIIAALVTAGILTEAK